MEAFVKTSRSRNNGFEILEDRRLMSVTAAPAYLVPTAPGVEVTPVLTAGDAAGDYRMAGIPDGLGAFDNGDGTFTVLMDHEMGPTLGVVRDHGAKGAFVSKWVIDKSTLNVLSGDDLINAPLTVGLVVFLLYVPVRITAIWIVSRRRARKRQHRQMRVEHIADLVGGRSRQRRRAGLQLA